MSEEKLTSNTFEVEAKSHFSTPDNKESYKPISEDIGLENVASDTAKNSNMVRENGDSALQDGADEKMLGSSDKEALALKNIDVKFISGDPNINGDAKIEMGNVEKAFTGMTKDELMKYANDPFWIKLRWVLFIAFWALWICMLAGAVLIIFLAPKCAAPTPLTWYEKGPLITIEDGNDSNIDKLKDLKVEGVIYELPAGETYFVDKNADIEKKIRDLVEKYNARDIKVVVDLTPNYVTQEDELFKEAKEAETNSEVLGAFAIGNENLNWLEVNAGDGKKAFKKHGKHVFLCQFGDFIDVKLDNPKVEEKFKNVLSKLVEIGVKGFRLNNAKFFKINEPFSDERTPDPKVTGGNIAQYKFFLHPNRVYVDGLGEVIANYANYVHNITNDEGFLSIIDSVSDHESNFGLKQNTYGFDLPKLSITKTLINEQPKSSTAKKVHSVFQSQKEFSISSLSSMWMQLPFSEKYYENLEASAFYMFVSLLRGVQIAPYEAFVKVGLDKVKTLQEAREKVAIQFGSFDYIMSENDTAIGYTRIKSGNPGYFVVLNPSSDEVTANFSSTDFGADTSLEVFMTSDNFKHPKAKYIPTNIDMPAESAAIFTFVPK